MKDIFTKIYQNKVWYNGSGSGSLPENTIEYRKFLQDYLKDNSIKSVVDFGCGDWQFSKLINWDGIDYLGFDVVDFLIKKNNKEFSKDNIHFKVIADYNKLPVADLLLVKDVLQHWPNQEIKNFLQSLVGKYPFVLITNSINGEGLNKDILVGEFRPLDLLSQPFNIEGREVFRYKVIRKKAKIVETKVVAIFELKK